MENNDKLKNVERMKEECGKNINQVQVPSGVRKTDQSCQRRGTNTKYPCFDYPAAVRTLPLLYQRISLGRPTD